MPGAEPPPEDAARVLERINRIGTGVGRSPRSALPGDPRNRFAEVAGVPCSAYPIPYDWGAMACLTALPTDRVAEAVPAVVDWLDRHATAGWQLEVTPAQAGALTRGPALREVRRHGVWWSAEPPPAVELEVTEPADEAEFLSVFGEVTAPMILGQLGRPDWYLGMLRDAAGRAVGTFRLMDLGGTAYLGGITIEPESRGRGLGRALSAWVTTRGRQRSDLMWLHCAPSLGPLYASVGYVLIGEHAYLGRR